MIKNRFDICIGEKIELFLDKTKKDERYLSKVEDIIDSVTFVITRPIGRRCFAHLIPGQTIEIVYFREDSAYCFDADVIECISSGQTMTAVVRAVSEKRKLQRRDYFRLSVMVPVTVGFWLHGKKVIKKYDTVDISGGGIRIQSSEKIEVGSKVELSIDICGIKDREITGSVVRCMLSEKSTLYNIGIKFDDISPRDRQTIIQFIFARQRELLKKGIK